MQDCFVKGFHEKRKLLWCKLEFTCTLIGMLDSMELGNENILAFAEFHALFGL